MLLFNLLVIGVLLHLNNKFEGIGGNFNFFFNMEFIKKYIGPSVSIEWRQNLKSRKAACVYSQANVNISFQKSEKVISAYILYMLSALEVVVSFLFTTNFKSLPVFACEMQMILKVCPAQN